MESITLRGDLLNISVGKLDVVLREGMAARKSKQLGGKTIDIDIHVLTSSDHTYNVYPLVNW